MAKKVSKPKEVLRKITLRGLTDIMFDRYPGDNNTKLREDQKLYLNAKKEIVLPVDNLVSLLTAVNTSSAPRRFCGKGYKAVCQAILSYTIFGPSQSNFLRGGKPVVFGGFETDGIDPESGTYIDFGVPRLDKGVPNPKNRPVLPLPWELQFEMRFFPNDEVTIETVQNLLIKGCLAIGLGTYRGRFGKCRVADWE